MEDLVCVCVCVCVCGFEIICRNVCVQLRRYERERVCVFPFVCV